MMKLPTIEELKEAVFSMSKESAPRLDGFGAGFYHGCWEILCDDLLQAVHDFYKGAQQPRGFSSSIIVLIPKVFGASYWKEFRPISLRNFSSKILSKILTKRLNSLLPKLIALWQSGFVPSR